MKKITLTDPFTGIDFTALAFDNGMITAVHPLTGETIAMDYDKDHARFMLPVRSFNQIETVSIKQAADEMGITIQAVSKACASGKLPFKTLPNGAKMILKHDLELYNDTKSVGRPKKD